MQNPDYYTLRYYYGESTLQHRKDVFGDIITRPVDRRENYVKRCVGEPGDTLQIIANQVYINGEPLPDHEGVQYNYYVQTDGSMLSASMLEKIGISMDDRRYLNPQLQGGVEEILNLGLSPEKPVYHFPLTQAMKAELERSGKVEKIVLEPADRGGEVYPLGMIHHVGDSSYRWNRDNYGPIYIPRKGDQILLTEEN